MAREVWVVEQDAGSRDVSDWHVSGVFNGEIPRSFFTSAEAHNWVFNCGEKCWRVVRYVPEVSEEGVRIPNGD